jgi:hypothetical protein
MILFRCLSSYYNVPDLRTSYIIRQEITKHNAQKIENI